MIAKKSKSYILKLITFGISCFFSIEAFAQNQAPILNQWACVAFGTIYYTPTGTYYDFPAAYPTGTRVYYYNPNGQYASNFASSSAYSNYMFSANSPTNETCQVNAFSGVRGMIVCKPSFCDVDDFTYIFILSVLLFLAYLHFNRNSDLKTVVN